MKPFGTGALTAGGGIPGGQGSPAGDDAKSGTGARIAAASDTMKRIGAFPVSKGRAPGSLHELGAGS